ncbi:DNA repair protein RecN [bacterium]|nr:DNA repair protein RecN [bacterium]
MLVELRIQNFAIIEELSLELSPHLNIISGETGSGKSLVLDAFQLILGARPKTSYFRKGTDGWCIEALLSLADVPEQVRVLLPEQVREEEEILLHRTMNTAGRGKVYLNGQLATVQMLQQIATKMLALCTQGQQMHLHDPRYILSLVDDYVGCGELLARYEAQYRLWQEQERALQALLSEKEARVRKQAEIEFLLHELSELQPVAGLREELEGKVRRAHLFEETVAAIQSASGLLLDDTGVFALLNQLRRELNSIPEGARPSFDEQLGRAEEELSELERQLGSFQNEEELTTEELEEASHRLSELARLERKYKTDDAGLELLYEGAKRERDEFGAESGEQEIRARLEAAEQELLALGAELRKERVRGGASFEKDVKRELTDLGMKSVRLTLDFEHHEPREHGTETVKFLFSPNPGEELQLLQETASGGELSRVMLVLKKLFRDRSGVNILVFDEVDTGVSGAVAQAVGEKMSEISKFSQVVCITHLPQVACYAEKHFAISKESGRRTRSVLKVLEGDARIEELAKMVSGYEVTPAARESARELLSSKEMSAKPLGAAR